MLHFPCFWKGLLWMQSNFPHKTLGPLVDYIIMRELITKCQSDFLTKIFC